MKIIRNKKILGILRYMINGDLSQLLDNGWYGEVQLFYNDHLYCCEGWRNHETSDFTFYGRKQKVKLNSDFVYYSYVTTDGEPVDYKVIYEATDVDIDRIKRDFLKAKIFEVKSFWKVEKNIVWMDSEDYDHPIYAPDDQSIGNQ